MATAEWKKVIVSGSAAVLSQVNVSTNQQIGTTQATTFLTGSFTGSFSGNGQGLTGISATSLDIDAFGSDLTSITVAATDKLPLSDAGTEGRINVGQLATPLAGTGLEANSNTIRIAAAAAGNGLTGGAGSALAVGAGTHITVNSDDIAVNTATLIPAISGSIFTTVSGDIAITALGVATIAANSVLLGTDTTGDYVATIDPGNGLTGGATSGEGVAHTLAVGAGTHITVNANDVAVNTTTLTPAISGSIFTQVSGDIAITAAGVAAIGTGVIVDADINASAAIVDTKLATIATAGKVSNSATTATNANTANAIVARDASGNFSAGTITANLTGNASGTAATVTGAAQTAITSVGTLTGVTVSGTAALTTLTVSGNATVTGDLTVNGTTTVIDTTNLSVEDRFVVLNHGSGSVSPAQEGGIIVEGTTAGSGSAFYYDGGTDLRWGVALGVADNATSVTANSYVVTVSGSAANPAGNPTYGGSAAGYGNMYVNTNDNTIWIFA